MVTGTSVSDVVANDSVTNLGVEPVIEDPELGGDVSPCCEEGGAGAGFATGAGTYVTVACLAEEFPIAFVAMTL